MVRKEIFGLLSLCAFFCVSCNKYLLSEKDIKEDIFIESFEAVSDVDLSARSNWVMVMNFIYPYNYKIEGQTIKAYPKDEPCFIPGSYIEDNENGEAFLPFGSGPIIFFASPDYYSEFLSVNIGTTSGKFADQTTEDRLLAADCLKCQYTGKASSNISGNLIHHNALLDFELKNVPSSATAVIESQGTIQPFRDKKNPQHYKAIVFAYWGEYSAQVHVAMNDKIYIIKLVPTINQVTDNSDPNLRRHIIENTYYKFTLSYDDEKDAFSITDVANTVWSEIRIACSDHSIS